MLQCRYASCKLYKHLHNLRPVASPLLHFIIASAFTVCRVKESAYSLDGNGYSEGSQKYHHPHYFVNARTPLPPTWKQDWECRKLTHSILRQTRYNFYCFRWGLYLKNFKNSDKIIITTLQEKHLTSLRNNNYCIGISIQTTRIFTNSTGCFYNYLEYSCKIWHSFYKRRFCHTLKAKKAKILKLYNEQVRTKLINQAGTKCKKTGASFLD